MPHDTSKTGRRQDLDWLRIGALGLLILTHTAYVYRTDGWRVQSEHAGLWADMLIYIMAPWRISLVFFIAGAATRFMLERHDLMGFVRNRTMRMLVPFLMAVIVLVPTMQYIAEPSVRGANYLDFLLGPGLHTHEVLGVWAPDLGHVWFLIYVFLYAIIAGLVWRFGRKAFAAADRAIAAASVWTVIGALALCFVLADAVIGPVFPRTNMLVDDPAGHVRCLAPFILGLFLARPSAFWTRLKQSRGWLASLVLSLFVLAVPLAINLSRSDGNPPLAFLQLTGVASGVYGATTMFLILCLAHTTLNRPAPTSAPGLAYLGDAIMPIYLMHQPVIVFVAAALHDAGLPLWAEFGLVLSLAAGFPLVVYHFIVRPNAILRVLFGLKAKALPAPPAPEAEPAEPLPAPATRP